MGGANRQDVRINLIAVGATRPFPWCPCHDDIHHGRITGGEVLGKVSAREKVLQPSISTVMNFLRQLSKPSARDVAQGIEGWNREEVALLRRTLLEAGMEHLIQQEVA